MRRCRHRFRDGWTSWADDIRNGDTVQIPDTDDQWAEQPGLREVARLRGFRSLLLVPLVRDRITIGQISVTRREAGRFAPQHVQLLQTFADQAVIAIGNVQLFDEVQAKTADLSEAACVGHTCRIRGQAL